MSKLEGKVGRLDVLVNNSGIYEFASIEDLTEEHYRRQFDVTSVSEKVGRALGTTPPSLRTGARGMAGGRPAG